MSGSTTPLRELTEASAGALAIVVEMFDAFPHSEKAGDDAAIARFRHAIRCAEKSYQDRVHDWMMQCFGTIISADTMERNHRFLEEALELVQANGCTVSEAHQLVDYVFGRPVGEPEQEVGGVRVTLAALCNASGIDEDIAAETELARVWTKVAQIRAKQAAKPKHSPLPASVDTHPKDGDAVAAPLVSGAVPQQFAQNTTGNQSHAD